MLKLSKKIDYGLMAISHIAYRGEDRAVNARHIAEEYNIPTELLAKILQRLAREGMITSQNGPKGGYILSRRPSEITVGQVIKAIEGPITITECYKDEAMGCEQYDWCTVRSPIRKIQDTISYLLDHMTIEEINQTAPLEIQSRC
jgi:Rrf2 family protein